MCTTIKIGQRLKEARLLRGYTQEELGKSLGLNKSTIQRYETGKISSPKLPVLQAFANQLNVNPGWLVLKSDERELPVSKDVFSYSNIMPLKKHKIPLLGEIACGEPIFAAEDRESYVEIGTDVRADFCLRANGDSMINARINDGDIVFIRSQPMVENGEIAAVIIGDEATLKRVYYNQAEGQLVLNPENPAYSPLVYTGEQLNSIRILGKAVAFQSDIK
jgi:repressor LexA